MYGGGVQYPSPHKASTTPPYIPLPTYPLMSSKPIILIDLEVRIAVRVTKIF